MVEASISSDPNSIEVPIELYAESLGGHALATAVSTDREYARLLTDERTANAGIGAIRESKNFSAGAAQEVVAQAVHKRNARRIYEERVLGIPYLEP